MSKQAFQTEKEGQIKFFEDLKINAEVELIDNADGIYRGTLFEFKLNISNINANLFQAIKYLSRMRIKGIGIPKNILLVSLNKETAYLFDSQDFIKDIEKIYVGAASKNNEKFDTQIKPDKINYSTLKGLQTLTGILDTDDYTKINIDVFCVVGWAERFYRTHPNAKKLQMFTELREPKIFEKYINAWHGNEEDFKYIMDCLNDKMHKKELGAFYTPAAYCKKATELVRKAIAQIPKENDYIILDRCAGTGNLQEFLTDKNVADITICELEKYLSSESISDYLKTKTNTIKNHIKYSDYNKITMRELEQFPSNISIYDYLFDNELSHCVVNTYELKEWVVLNKLIGDKVRIIIPPPDEVNTNNCLVKGADALDKYFIYGNESEEIFEFSNEYFAAIKQLNDYVKDEKTNIIMFENPPYSEVAGGSERKSTKKNLFKNSFVCSEMKKQIKGYSSNDITNLFIWSAQKYYLRKKEDSYILFSPVKYFKNQNLMNKTFKEGYILNRKYFHATTSAISCIWWQNEIKQQDNFPLTAIDINKELIEQLKINPLADLEDKMLIPIKDVIIKKVNTSQSSVMKSVSNGFAFLVSQGFAPDFKHGFLRNDYEKVKKWHNSFIWINKDNYYLYLPFWVSNCYVGKAFADIDVYFKSADGGDAYTKDADFLRACFIFTCLSQKNHCLSFFGTDNVFYKNELCFDNGTIASEKLKEFTLTDTEDALINNFNEILTLARDTENYNPKFIYGTYQIDKELNTSEKDEAQFIEYHYPELNTKIIALKTKLASYYEEIIQPKLFEYELLK